MVIDWEHHFTPKSLVEKAKGVDAYWEMQTRLAKFTADVQVKFMDEAGVDKAVITGAARSLDECRIFNDEAAKWVEEYPDRFIGFAHTVPTGGDEALEELDRSVKDLGFKGCKIMSCIDSSSVETSKDSVLLDDPVLYPFYKKVVELDVPLFVHPAFYPPYPYALPDPLRSKLRERRIPEREFELTVAIVRLVEGGVLEKFPNLKVTVSHLGGVISFLLEYLWSSVNRGEERQKMEKFRKDFEKIYVDTAAYYTYMDTLKFTLARIGSKRILFGTDQPAGRISDPKEMKRWIQKIEKLDISDRDKQLVLEGNAVKLLKI